MNDFQQINAGGRRKPVLHQPSYLSVRIKVIMWLLGDFSLGIDEKQLPIAAESNYPIGHCVRIQSLLRPLA